jgi:hypothetical protein
MGGFSNKTTGGAVPLLLSKIVKEPILGGALQEESMSNRMVGMITKTAAMPEKAASRSVGGELLNNLSKLKFGTGSKTRNQENIKFIY